MSQIYKNSSGGGGGGSVTQVNTQSGNATPSAGILLLNAYDTTENNDNGIETKGGTAGGDPPGTGATNETDVYLTNRQTGTVTTVGAVSSTIITFPLGATPGTYQFYGNVQAFNASTPASGSYSFASCYRTDGVTAVEVGGEFNDQFEDVVLEPSDIRFDPSSNNALLVVTGVTGLTINWNAKLEYRRVF